MIDLGTCRPGSTIYIPFDTFAIATGAPTAVTNFAVGDILIFKDGSDVERASTTGFTATTSFNSVTGLNLIVIDLSSDATGDFFKCGSRYCVGVSPITADGQTMAFWAATFDIGYPGAVLNTSIATLASQTSFTLTAGPAEDDALNGMWAVVHDKASAVQLTWVQILDYTGSTKTVTLAAVPAATFTMAAIDNISVMGVVPLQPTTTGTRLDVSSGGEAGLDWANIGSATTAQNLSATNIDVDQIVASVSGAVGSVTGAVGSVTGNVGGNVVGSVASVTARVTANVDQLGGVGQSLTDLKDFADTGYDPATHKVAGVVLTDTLTTYTGNTVQTGDSFARIGLAGAGLTNIDLPNQTMNITGDITGNLSGSVGSVTGAVGSVTGNVGGNVTGSVGSVVGIRIKKNTALAKFSFLMVLAADHLTPATGKTIVVAVSLDGGAFGAATNTPATEIGNGVYYIDLAAGDLNGNVVVLKMTEAACDQNTVVIVTEP